VVILGKTCLNYQELLCLLMDAGKIYNESAFKHGVTEADIEWAFLHPIANGLLPRDMHHLL